MLLQHNRTNDQNEYQISCRFDIILNLSEPKLLRLPRQIHFTLICKKKSLLTERYHPRRPQTNLFFPQPSCFAQHSSAKPFERRGGWLAHARNYEALNNNNARRQPRAIILPRAEIYLNSRGVRARAQAHVSFHL